ncbi:MAG TPA: 30S ribosomal protein S9 [Cyclobacteriaceae bacterium]|jgi:small subunit ribosomal protein S9|nr:30S ribosomal protein S9 [Cyclobacteriaceae bacterium]
MEIINATGRRKTSVARVYVTPGKGDIRVNARDLKEYFLSEIHQTLVKQPLVALKAETQYDVTINVEGGGIKGQAEAVRLGIARALVQFNGENKPALRKEGFVTRDSRMVERKKPGRRKARRKFQFSKR